MKLPRMLMIMCVVAGCAQMSEERKPTAAPPQPQAVAPAPAPAQRQAPAPALAPAPAAAAAPAPAPAAPPQASAAGGGQGAEMVTGTVTKIGKEMDVLELQTPGGWSQFLVTDPERKKELERITVGDGVDVKVEVRGSDRKVVSVIKRKLR